MELLIQSLGKGKKVVAKKSLSTSLSEAVEEAISAS
jgi:hypothetical protein